MDIFISSAEEAFLHVGSMIGFFILLFGYINYKTNGNFTYIISKNKKLQPLIGGLIGLYSWMWWNFSYNAIVYTKKT